MLLEELVRLREDHQTCQKRFQESQALSQCGSWEFDPTTGLGWLSHEQRRLFNLSPDETDTSPEVVLRHHHPDDILKVQALIQQAIHDGKPFTTETRVLCDDGTVRWLHAEGRPMCDATGNVVRLIGTTLDITERKRAQGALEDGHLRQQALQKAALDAVVSIDTQERVLEWNAVAAELFGYSADEALGRNLAELIIPPALRESHRRGIAHFLQTGEGPALNQRIEVPALHADGTEFPIELTAVPVQLQDELYFTASIRDLRPREAAIEALRQQQQETHSSEQRLQLALYHGAMGLWHVDLVAQEFLYVSERSKTLYGYAEDAHFTWADCLQQILPEDLPQVEQTIQDALQSTLSATVEFRIYHPDGSVRWLTAHGAAIEDSSGARTQLIGVSQDITERKRLEEQREEALREAQERAERDPLTHLFNHRSFHRRLEEETNRAQRENTTLAVIMLDLDNFKFFNDAYGHAIGDEVLRLLALRLQHICRPYDTLARFGGDEFALIFPNIGATSIADLEARIYNDMSGLSYQPEGYESAVPLTISLGVSVFPDDSRSRSELVELASAQLRRAKSGGESDSEAERTRLRMSKALEGFSMLDALVTAVDNKDRYTRRHSEDVLGYCLQIARSLGLDAETQHTLAVAALLHDVGKIGVPDAILRKPGKLTEMEFNAVRQHAAMGAAIVSAVPGLESILDCVRHHHERWDGTGYPSGLGGENIPRLARLMAVADAFSAMTTNRPYRQGMPCEKARAILKDGAGTQWDPTMVEAFLASH
ncbi:sensor domain-containing diguanylate cyclase/phosphohydrolase [Armatimonas rosea]|uniref:Diguanylate cyclase (GGDEF)-like protein/PAS domain S-box-containing protein n=1 Tax=Armatimonas rosea TaxID=685828 RepID=A0A7W9SL94_ARMRO|nr:PAS domain S-box protein [Armatimonas rosea]MBB6048717.1 diguanylate cyclase (GGDEF)-like protein/PAS domain S-box-containing protein [Armatimonas rosea]